MNKDFRRYSKNLHNLLLKIIHDDLHDPIFDRVTINYVKLNRTKTFATVYLDLNGASKPELVVDKLNQLNYLFRKKLLELTGRYKAPYFKFVKDNILDMGLKVEKILSEELVVDDGER